jgi:hypothetical protein
VSDAAETIRVALNGDNPDQKRIAEQGLELVALLLRKNSDYGSAAWNPPVLDPLMSAGNAIMVRMSDKVARIASLNRSGTSPQVQESIEDTVRDLAGYGLLWLARPKEPAC